MTLTADFQARCGEPSDIAGHLPYLFERASKPGAVVVELGVRTGNSTAALLVGVEAGDGHLWSVDIIEPTIPAEWRSHPRWSLTIGDDLNFQVSDELPQAIDVLFIDTCHEYRHTLAELDLYGVRVRSGGVIMLHDADLEQAPLSNDPEDTGFPVRRAVQDWCRKRFLAPEFREGWYGLAVIEVT